MKQDKTSIISSPTDIESTIATNRRQEQHNSKNTELLITPNSNKSNNYNIQLPGYHSTSTNCSIMKEQYTESSGDQTIKK